MKAKEIKFKIKKHSLYFQYGFCSIGLYFDYQNDRDAHIFSLAFPFFVFSFEYLKNKNK